AWRDQYMRITMRDKDKIREGEIKGRREGKLEKALEIAKKLIAEGMNVLDISQIVGLPLEEINSLAK
ncbi:MAG: hypothetical protein II948_01565, partial [Synergistaceae bacterium]|nr:hypothetical protein [Synergistaceae bacterium]